jgi:hypothetical protein
MKFILGRRRDDDDECAYAYRVRPADLGIVLVAMVITFGFVYLLLTPQNWGAIDRAMAPDPPKPQVQNRGETPMILFDARKK